MSEMSDKNQETIEGIVAEMRNGPCCCLTLEDIPQHYHDNKLFYEFAGRIEAALKRSQKKTTMCAVSLTLDEAIAHADVCADDTPCGQNHKQLADWLRELKMLRSQNKRASEYVYAIQTKYQGHWRIFEDGFSSPDETKEHMNEMRRIYPRAEFRIVRRPAELWEDWEVAE